MAFTKITHAGIGSTGTVLLENLEVTGVGTFGGSVSVGGTLTYEDVTNIDSVGLITARNGIVVGSGITLSKDGDVFFTGIATGNGSGITNLPAANLTGTLPAISGANLTNLDASDLASGTVPTARLGSGTASSSTFLRGDSTFQTVNTDLVSDTSPQLGGNLDVNTKNILFGDSSDGSSDDALIFGAGSDLRIYHDGSTNVINAATSNAISFRYGGNEQFFIGNAEFKGADNKKIKLGTGDDMQLYHDGTTNYIECGASNFAIRVNSGNRIEVNGTSGDVTLQGGSGKNFTWDNSTAYLNLNDNARLTLGTGNDLFMYHNGSNTIFDQDGTGSLFFQIGGANKFYVQSGGAQFVGTLYGDDSNTIQLGNDQDFQFNHNGTDSIINSTSGGLYIANAANNQHIFLKKATGGDIRILDSSSNNTHIFETGGALRFLGSQTRETSNSNSILSSGNNSLDFSGSEYMYFRTNGVERARFQMSNNGYFQVGRSGNTPANAHVGVAVQNTICAIQTISDGSSGHEHIRFNNSNGEVGRITTSGSSTIYYTSSDYRLKENDVAISDGVARVKQLRPIKFNWKSNPSETVDGFFAHEVQAIVPEAVDGSKDQVVTQADIDGGKYKQDQLGDPLYQAYDASYMVPVLTAAIKELITRVENLESS